jgi:hypothetical protein
MITSESALAAEIIAGAARDATAPAALSARNRLRDTELREEVDIEHSAFEISQIRKPKTGDVSVLTDRRS